MSSQTINTNLQSEYEPEIPTDPESCIKIYYLIGFAKIVNLPITTTLANHFHVHLDVATQFIEQHSVFLAISDMHKHHTNTILSFDSSSQPPDPQLPPSQCKEHTLSPCVPSLLPDEPLFHPLPVIKALNHVE